MKRFLGIFALGAMMMTSCTEDDTQDVVGNVVDNNSVSLISLVTDDSPIAWGVEDEVGVFQFSNGEAIRENYKYYNASYNAGYASFLADDADATLYYVDGKADVLLYYPYSSGFSGGTSVPLDLSDQSDLGSLELYSTDLTTLTKGEAVDLPFVSRLDFPRLAFTFKADATTAADMTNSTISISGLATTGGYDLLSAETSVDAVDEDIVGITCDAGSNSVEVIVLPQSVASDGVVTLMVESPVFGYNTETLQITTLVNSTTAPFEVVITEAGMTVTAGDIQTWDPAEGETGNAYDPSNIVVGVEAITIDTPSSTTIDIGAKIEFTASITPSNATIKDVEWISSNPAIAAFEGNVLTAISEGDTTITAKSTDGTEIISEVGVAITVNQPVSVDGVKLNETTLALGVGETYTLVATVSPGNAAVQSVTWSTSDENIASVEDGVVTAIIANSTVDITATTVDGDFVATCKITTGALTENETLSVGDYLYSDLSHSTNLDKSKNLLGVVYSLDEGSTTTGMIMHINTDHMEWAVSGSTYATTHLGTSQSTSDIGIGVANMKIAAAATSNAFTDLPAFAYVDTFNDPDLDYSTLDDDATGVWALPSEGDIKAFVPGILADGYNSVINNSIYAAGGDKIVNLIYFSTCIEISSNLKNHRCVTYNASNVQSANGIIKTNAGLWVRPVMAFDLNDTEYYSAE